MGLIRIDATQIGSLAGDLSSLAAAASGRRRTIELDVGSLGSAAAAYGLAVGSRTVDSEFFRSREEALDEGFRLLIVHLNKSATMLSSHSAGIVDDHFPWSGVLRAVHGSIPWEALRYGLQETPGLVAAFEGRSASIAFSTVLSGTTIAFSTVLGAEALHDLFTYDGGFVEQTADVLGIVAAGLGIAVGIAGLIGLSVASSPVVAGIAIGAVVAGFAGWAIDAFRNDPADSDIWDWVPDWTQTVQVFRDSTDTLVGSLEVEPWLSPIPLLSWAAHGPLGALVSTVLARSTKEMSPSEVADYFDELPPDEARLLVLSDPLRFGNLEGVPIDLRDEANRITAEQERRRLQTELDSLMVEVRNVGSGSDFDVGKRFLTGKIDVGFRFWEPNDESVVRANEILARIGTLDQVLGGDDLKILAFGPAGDGKVAVAIGDVERADDIALIVPGMGTDLGNFDGTLGNARRLHDEMWKVGNPGDYATIAWLDYDAPDSLPDATSGHKATSQAYRLRDTIADLRISNHDAHITVISHSYGGRLTGEAAKMGLEVDDLVFVGGPGTGNNRASDLRLNEGGGVWAGRAADDKIAAAELVDTHGPDPTGADFGAELITTDGASGHSEYFDEGTESLTNLAKISRRIPPETQAVDSGADAIDRGIWSVKRVLRTPTRLTPIAL